MLEWSFLTSISLGKEERTLDCSSIHFPFFFWDDTEDSCFNFTEYHWELNILNGRTTFCLRTMKISHTKYGKHITLHRTLTHIVMEKNRLSPKCSKSIFLDLYDQIKNNNNRWGKSWSTRNLIRKSLPRRRVKAPASSYLATTTWVQQPIKNPQ